jgi:sigma-B regulation protein RsbU (phosphoserine phosphatase)
LSGRGEHLKRDQVVRILLVEDNLGDARLIKEALSETEKIKTEIEHVDTLAEMKKRFSGGTFDLIILDLSLPDASGLETVSRTNQIAPETAIVVLTGLNDEDVAIKAVQQGAQDYLVKGQADARSLEKVILYALERNQAKIRIGALKNELAHALIEIDEELEISASIQRKIIQQNVPDDWKDAVSIYYSFAKKIGGDIFDITNLPDGRTAFVVADGSGHSVHAALISIMFKLSFKHQLERSIGPKDLVEKINRELHPFFLENMFFTVFSVWIDKNHSSITYTNAGHPAQYLISPERNEIFRLKHEGIPICIDIDTEYSEDSIEIRKGDKLVLFTDGIYECFNECGEQFGEERLGALLKENMGLSVSELRRKVIETSETYSGQVDNNFGQRDDSILIVAQL